MGTRGRAWQLISAVLLTVTVAWMAAPTYPMAWMTDPSLSPEDHVTYHSWLDPLILGYAGFHASVTFIAATIAAALAWYGFAVRDPRRTPSWWAVAAVVVLVGWSAVLGAFGWSQALVVALLLVGAATAVLAARRARA